VTLSISAESVAVAKEVAKSLNQTAIPGYVLTYGMFRVPSFSLGHG